MRSWSWIVLMGALGCGPRVGAGEGSTDSSGSDPAVDTSAETGPAGDATGNATGDGKGDAEGTTSTAEGSSGAPASEGSDGSTGEPPASCAPDDTALGPGMVEWSEIDPAVGDVAGMALTPQGVFVVGTSSDESGAAAIERFQLDGLPYWSTTWTAQGGASHEAALALALPDGRVVAGFTAVRANGTSEEWLVAYGAGGEIAWELSLDVGHAWQADVSPSGSIVVVSVLGDAPPNTVVLVEIGADGIELDRTEHVTEEPASVHLSDVAVGPDGEVVAGGFTTVGRGFGGWIARWDAAHTLEWWTDHAGASAIAVAPDGDLLLVEAIFGAGALIRLAPDGRLRWKLDVEWPMDVAVDCAGRILLGTHAQVEALDPDGRLLWNAPIDGGAAHVLGDPGGDVFAAGGVTIYDWLTVARVSGT